MEFSVGLVLAGLLVGFVVGPTGMGGGALMTPILIFFFGIDPLKAVGSDLVVSLFMKPVGALVHIRRGTVNYGLVKWLCLGSVPGALFGVFFVDSLGDSQTVEDYVTFLLGVALLISVTTMAVKAVVSLRQYYLDKAAGVSGRHAGVNEIGVRPLPTVLVGALGGAIVGMTSVGSGSLIIVGLLLLYPLLRASDLVGTDLVQAVPLVGAAALGHVVVGNFDAPVAVSLLIGALPGVFVGSRVSSSSGQSGLIRRALMLVLLASGLKLVGLPPAWILAALVAFVVLAPVLWAGVRNTEGFTRRPHTVTGVHWTRLVVAAATGVPPRFQGTATDGPPSAQTWDPDRSAADPL